MTDNQAALFNYGSLTKQNVLAFNLVFFGSSAA